MSDVDLYDHWDNLPVFKKLKVYYDNLEKIHEINEEMDKLKNSIKFATHSLQERRKFINYMWSKIKHLNMSEVFHENPNGVEIVYV